MSPIGSANSRCPKFRPKYRLDHFPVLLPYLRHNPVQNRMTPTDNLLLLSIQKQTIMKDQNCD